MIPHVGQPLAGFVVVLTADRRADEWVTSLELLGAAVHQAPVLRIESLGMDRELIQRTLAVIDQPPDDVIITTAIGLRGWVEAAEAVGLGPGLVAALSRTRLLARGPKARGAAITLGLPVSSQVSAEETSGTLADLLIAQGVRGRRMVVQQHGAYDEALIWRLRTAGATVANVPIYRWGPPPDEACVSRAITMVAARTTDAVIFVSAPGVKAFLSAARAAGRFDEVIAALREDVVPAAIGPVTASPLRAAGVTCLMPERFRLGALVRALSQHLAGERVNRIELTGGAELELRGQLVLLDGEPLPLAPGPLAVLRTLAERPGDVVDRERLLTVLPGTGSGAHAVDVAVGRLRAGLGRPGVVQTVVKRGYRLAVPPP